MKRVLIVDDEQEIRKLIKSTIVEHEECEFQEASNVMEALKYLRREEFDILITDLKMKPHNGLSLIRKYAGKLHIIVVSGDYEKENLCLKMGAKNFISKPLRPERLIYQFERSEAG